MRYIYCFTVVCACFLSVSAFADENIATETTSLTEDEITLFQKIADTDSNFHFSNKVKRYFHVDPESEDKTPFFAELVFKREDDLYFDEFIGYSVSFVPGTHEIRYEFDAGTSFRGSGTFGVYGDNIMQTERSCGTDKCTYDVLLNGKSLHQSSENLWDKL